MPGEGAVGDSRVAVGEDGGVHERQHPWRGRAPGHHRRAAGGWRRAGAGCRRSNRGTDDQGRARALRRGPHHGHKGGGPPAGDPPQGRTRMTIPDFRKRKAEGRKIVVVTAYDALFTRIAEEAGIEVLLVGDSLGVVVQGKKDTLSVTMEDMLYHTRLVAGAAQHALVIADMPFLSYQVSVEEAVRNAGRFLQAGAAAVKLEGGAAVVDRGAAMTRFGIPVMGHLGMTPQSVHQYGGGKGPGEGPDQGGGVVEDARAPEAAGARAGGLEGAPAARGGT